LLPIANSISASADLLLLTFCWRFSALFKREIKQSTPYAAKLTAIERL
jgi:hypothetical protein